MAKALLELNEVDFHHKILLPKVFNPLNRVKGLGIEKISLSLISGNIIGLVGPNGAGKTTLMKLLAGLLIPDDGEIIFNGKKLENKQRPNWSKKMIGMMPENIHWYGTSTPFKVIERLFTIRNMKNNNIEKFLDFVGLGIKAHDSLDSLSQGMHQRLSLACALIGSPEILLLDEPMNGLDPVAREAFAGVLKNLAKQGKAILISSHQLAELERMVDSVILMHNGEIIEKGNLENIRKKYGIHNDLVLKFPKEIENLENILSKKNFENLNYKIFKTDDDFTIKINSPKGGWDNKTKQEILQCFISNDIIPFDFTSQKIELVEILSAVTGLDVDKIGMSLREKGDNNE
ncbi:MAG: ABC transporter ATP-binding protein, partial [Candidatus Thermoplasmatota archaeon]|nr:ABC transporter ATP-binding protein [Candidatus Thermoplasmatota archaeon]